MKFNQMLKQIDQTDRFYVKALRIIFFVSFLCLMSFAQINNQDIGAVGASGSYTQVGGTVTINGSGADIWGNADEFHYVYIPVTGDCELSARIVSISNSDAWAKAGVMIRETLTAGSKHAFSCMTYSNGFAFQRRLTTDGTSTNNNFGVTVPYYVKMTRSGDNFTSAYSSDGVTWIDYMTETISMNQSVYIGLAVTSHNDGTLCTSVCDNIVFPNPAADFSADQTVVEAGTTVNFTNESTNASTFSWSFDSGTPTSSTDIDPSVTYNTPGIYQVSLIATSGIGVTDTETKNSYITVTNPIEDITDDGGTTSDEREDSDTPYLTDNNTSTRYQVRDTNFWVQYQATAYYITNEYRITFSTSGTDRAPRAWQFLGSNDGSSWATLDTRTNQTFTSGQTRSFTFTTSNYYQYYRLQITANNGNTRTEIAEWEIYGYQIPVTAEFSGSPTTIYRTQSVNFTNESIVALNYNWTFPGGTPGSSTAENPIVTYNTVGTYSVTLVADDGSGNSDTETKTNYITVQAWPAPTADFSASATTIDNGATVTFTNTSTNAISYSWTFEGGTPSTSTATNPTITYSTPGTYDVTLIATNTDGVTDTETKTDHITVTVAPIDLTSDGGDISIESGTSTNGMTYLIDDNFGNNWYMTPYNRYVEYHAVQNYVVTRYTLTTAGYGRTYDPSGWVFYGSEDGNSWTALDTRSGVSFSNNYETQSFTFSNTNRYEYYRLDVTAANNGTYTTLSEIEIYGLPAPTAEFSSNATAAYPGNSISFYNESLNAVSYSWSFPGGTPSTSTAENPVVAYSSLGTYNVSLTITDASSNTDTETKTNYITIISPPTPVPGAGHTYNFAGTSLGSQAFFRADDDESLSLPNQGTLEVWVYLNDYTQAGGIIHKGADLNDQEYSLQLKLEEIPKITVDLGAGSDGNGREILLTNQQLSLNTYYHVAVTWDNNANTCKLYINGRLDDVGSDPFDTSRNTGPLLLGVQLEGTYAQDPSLGHVAFDGFMDEVRIWDTALTQTRIRDWMCKKVTPSHPDWNHLQAYYRFEEILDGSDITIDDISLNDNVAIAYESSGLVYGWSPFPVGDDAVYTIDPLSSLYYTTSESDSLVLDYIIGDFNYAAIVYNDMAPNYTNYGGDVDDIFTDHYWDIWSDENSASFDFFYYYNDYENSYTPANFRLLSRNEPAENPWTDSYTTNNTANGEFKIEDMFLRQQFCLGGSDAAPFTGNNYYVRPDGNNANDGTTPGTAWATIEYAALQSLTARDTIFIAAGSYAAFDVSHSGSTTFPIVYYGDTTGEYFDGYAGAGEISVGSGTNYTAEISGQSNVALLNMTLENSTQAGLYVNSSSNIRVENCEFPDNGAYSINAVGTSGYLKIKDNTITSGSSAGVRVASSAGTIDITSNEILKTSGSNLGNGVEIYATDFNLINSNAIVGVDDGINITSCPIGGTIKENTIVNPTGNGIYINDAQNGSIKNNLIYGDGSTSASGINLTNCDFNVINNTIDNVGGNSGDYGIYGNNCGTGIWKNNIVTNNNYGIYYVNGTPSVYYNCIYGNTNTYNGYNAITSDPRYVDTDGADNATGIDNWRDDDYHIQSSFGSYHDGIWSSDTYFSPCIDAGDPTDAYSNEPDDNGDRINCGRYGGTTQASLSGGFAETFSAPDSSWIMLGVPLYPSNSTPFAVYGDDFGAQMPLTINGTDTTWNGWMCIRWEANDTSSEYYEYGDGSEYQPPNCEPGISHFIYHNLAEVVDIDLDGMPVSSDISQDCFKKPNTGWGPTAYGLNMFANPFRATVDMGQFVVVRNGTEYTIPQAASNGWVSPYLYTWSYVSQNYDTYLINDLNDVYPIPKWQGFWFAQLDTDSDIQLKMPFSARIGVGKTLAAKQALDATEQLSSLGTKYYLKESSYDKKWDWFLKFGVVSADFELRDLENFVGVYESAKNETDPWDGIDVSTVSQMQDEYVQLFMPHEEGGVYSSDMHSQENSTNSWQIKINKKSDKEDFIFVWPHIRQVPQNIQLSLLSEENDTLVQNLRDAEGYEFTLTDDVIFNLVSKEIEDNGQPEFTFTITQNHYLPEFVNMYIVPSEPLQDFDVKIDGVTAEYTKLNSPPNLYKVNFSITDNQLPDITITGADYAGNSSELEIEKGLNISLAKVSTQVATTIETQEFAVYFNENVFQRQTPVIVSSLPQDLTYPVSLHRVSNPISITPEDLTFDNKVTLKYKSMMQYADAELHKYENDQWKFIATYSDEMELPGTGIYALFSKSGQTNDDVVQIIKDFELANPSPNPFNNSTVIRFKIANGGNINLAIYNLLGERVSVLENKYMLQGEYEITWNGKNSQGNSLPSGIYFVKMQNSKRVSVKKITLLK